MARKSDLPQKILELHNDGISRKEIASQLGCCGQRVRFILRRAGHLQSEENARRRVEQTEQAIALFQSGLKAKEIGFRIGLSPGRVRFILRKAGYCFSGRRYDLDQNYFDEIDREDKAYFLGLLYADGNTFCNHRKYLTTLSLHARDRELLEKFNKYLGHDKPIYQSKDMMSVAVASKRMTGRLIELGVVPRKTFVTTFPDFLREDLKRHFMRGYFDGDGCLMGTVRKNQKRLAYYFSIVGTESLCLSIKGILEQSLDVNISMRVSCPERNNNIRTIFAAGNRQVAKIMDYLYDDATVFMQRKYDKYIALTEQNKSSKRLYWKKPVLECA